MDINDKKMNAAYALNLCTVSVSQIIDYDDTYIMEQEYEAHPGQLVVACDR